MTKEFTRSIDNVLASIAVKDLRVASAWYEKLFGRPGTMSMPELAEWRFPRGGWLQVYQLPERAGRGSFTLVVTDIAAEIKKLDAMGVDISQQSSDIKVKTVMVTDPDGNHIAFAETSDPSLAA
ncbi:MAG: VOC family protein [Rhodoferax sp.]